MKYTEENISKLLPIGDNKWRDGNGITLYLRICSTCGETFIGKQNSKYCSKKCFYNRIIDESTKSKIRIKATGRKLSEDTKKKISKKAKQRVGKLNPFYGKCHTEETKKRISESRKGKCKSTQKSKYYTSNKLPLYDTYAPQLDWCEEVRRNNDDLNILEVKCTYCGRWFIPNVNLVYNRISSLNGKKGYKGEQRFYCSDKCKLVCPIFAKTPEILMREDALRAGRLNWLELNREVQPELRQMVLARDKYKCVKCGSDGPLHCHHVLPVAEELLLSADVDNCVTLCEQCHKEAHNQDGCRYGQLRVEVC